MKKYLQFISAIRFLHYFVVNILLVALLFPTNVFSADPPPVTSTTTADKDSTCPNAGILGAGLVTNICWDCILPIALFGTRFTPGDWPEKANKGIVCSCEQGSSGLMKPGISAGFRSPARVLEVVRDPHCSPALNGIRLFKPSLLRGNPAEYEKENNKKYLNVNSWTFPLLYMIETLVDKNCSPGTATISLIGISSLSPTWPDDVLSFHLNFEAAIFAATQFFLQNMIDSTLINLNPTWWGNTKERDTWLWVLGSLSGSIYPLTGNIPHVGSGPRESAAAVAKSLALGHRVGQLTETMGAGNMCGGSLSAFLPKSQYKISQVFPQPQSSPPCCNFIGESPFKWNEWRNLPGYEDYVYFIFSWTDCCINLL